MNNPSNNFHRERRGFAAIMAISLIILVGAVLAVLGMYFAQEANRTRSEATEAQLRQLLSAGAIAAIQRADNPGPAKPLALPGALAEGHAAVTIEIAGAGDDRSAVVRASFEQRHLDETLRLHRAGGHWNAVAVDRASGDLASGDRVSGDQLSAAPASSPSTQPSDRSTAASQRS